MDRAVPSVVVGFLVDTHPFPPSAVSRGDEIRGSIAREATELATHVLLEK